MRCQRIVRVSGSRAGAGSNMILHTGRVEWTYIHPVTQTRTRGCWDFVNNRQC